VTSARRRNTGARVVPRTRRVTELPLPTTSPISGACLSYADSGTRSEHRIHVSATINSYREPLILFQQKWAHSAKHFKHRSVGPFRHRTTSYVCDNGRQRTTSSAVVRCRTANHTHRYVNNMQIQQQNGGGWYSWCRYGGSDFFFAKLSLKPLHLFLHTSAATSVKYTKVIELSNYSFTTSIKKFKDCCLNV